MKWHSTESKLGLKRTVKKFAWFPVNLTSNNYTVWLETYFEDQKFIKRDYGIAGGVEYEWDDIERWQLGDKFDAS